MKTMMLRYILLFLSLVCLVSCDEEDGFYNEKYINSAQLVYIQPSPGLYAGDQLYVGAEIPRLLPETGFTDPLDIYLTTSGAPSFSFSYILEKQNDSGEWDFVYIDRADMDVQEGTAVSGNFVLADAVYDSTADSYGYFGGIPLDTAGNYRLSFGVNSDEVAMVEFRSNTVGDNINLNILSGMSGLDGSGYYTFTVLP